MSESPPKKIPRFLSCLIKGPMGCLSFVVGAVVVFVLFMPPAVGRLLDRTLEDSFADRHEGRLELGDVWVGSFYGEQRVERLILRDPEGDEVLRASLRAPSLLEAWDGPRHRYGPVVVKVELLRLVEDEDGSNNLERALEPEDDESEHDDSRSGFSTDTPFEIELELVVERLRFSSASGKEEVLADLTFRGRLEWGPEATHLVLEGGADPTTETPLRLKLELERPEFGPRRAWSSALVLEHAPTALARALCVAVRPLAPFAGVRLDSLEWSRQGNEVQLRCADEGARFELVGEAEAELVHAGADGRLSVELPCASARGRTLLTGLLPFAAELACEPAEGMHRLTMADFAWPLDADWKDLAGDLDLRLAPLRCRPAAELEALLGETFLLAPLDSAPAHLAARDGRLEYAGFRLATDQGWLALEGELVLKKKRCDLELTGEHEGLPLGPLRLAQGIELSAPDSPSPLPPEFPGAPIPETPGD
jgi:hypothetical protein